MLPTVLHTMQPPTGQFPVQNRPRPYVKIVEQPSKSLRYRYQSEGRPSTVRRASSTTDNKTPFAIQVVGYHGRVVIVVSCVSKDEPYQPHPHSLVGTNCKKGVCTFETEITADNPFVTFPKLAVQCVKKNLVKEALRLREEKNIDPFLTGFGHIDDVKSIDLHAVRLCFQVFLKGESRGYTGVLTPVVSDPIFNSKTIPTPLIYKLSHCSSCVDGGQNEIILLCARVIKEDIQIRFFETNNEGQVVWEDFGRFQPSQIYNYTAICFKPPRYYNQDITEPVRVLVELLRPSDGISSKEAIPFEYLPRDSELGALKEKRKKYNNRQEFFDQLMQTTENRRVQPSPLLLNIEHTQPLNPTNDVSMGGNGSLLPDTTPWALPPTLTELPNFQAVRTPQIMDIPNLNQPSTSGGFVQINQQNWNIPSNNVPGETSGLSFDSASVVRLLNMDSQQELQPIHLSSGDLDMMDINRLSGNLQENLSLSDLLV